MLPSPSWQASNRCEDLAIRWSAWLAPPCKLCSCCKLLFPMMPISRRLPSPVQGTSRRKTMSGGCAAQEQFNACLGDVASIPSGPEELLAKIRLCPNCSRLGYFRRCAQCKVVAYCGVPCQRQHWAQHHSVCSLAARVARRFPTVVADCSAGGWLARNLCNYCGKRGKFRKCRGCNAYQYCSEKCQESDWPAHKRFECCKYWLREAV